MAPPRTPLLTRLMQRREISPAGCWLYTGHLDRYGYGQIREGRKRHWTVHRAAWNVLKGPVPEGMLVCHTCDVRNCFNPDHLFIGTWQDNVRDMISKGRKRVNAGEMHHMSKLTSEEVENIRKLRNAGWKLKAIAQKYGVGFQNVSLICLNKAWVENVTTK